MATVTLMSLHQHIASVHLSFAGNAPSSTATTPKQLVKPMSAQPVKTAPAVPVTSTSAPSISAARVQGLVDPSIRCTLCDKMCFDLEQHYKYSAQHPKCDLCGAGCATADDVVKVSVAGMSDGSLIRHCVDSTNRRGIRASGVSCASNNSRPPATSGIITRIPPAIRSVHRARLAFRTRRPAKAYVHDSSPSYFPCPRLTRLACQYT